ncbi:MAG TPA: iron-containing alcohol dehydrogenase, partial [Candidatus Polarisedimenticolia bacterium]|nr:iron-containing alcohol dehydrogenase [Candidatus Polarisedimenticolia bacterium]
MANASGLNRPKDESQAILDASHRGEAESWTASFGAMRIVFGPGRLESLGELARDLGGGRVLLVTDPGVRAAGHAARAEASLAGAGASVRVFDDVEENPT